VTPSLPRKIGDTNENAAKEYELDLYTLPVNVAGLPGFSFPAGYAQSGFPVGLQIIGPRWSDEELLDVGFELEKILGAPKIADISGGR
jgi:aspartyl-tRNA(Asn)/glutamyl-tRNA(Gln) amidotransferase subunit A